MNFWLCSLLSILIGFSLSAQVTLEPAGQLKVPSSCGSFTIDQFGDHYLLLGEELQKRFRDKSDPYSYSDPLLGQISKVDALDPMNPILFYNEVNAVHLLDNRLNLQTTYSLLDAGFIDPTLVAYADEQAIWIYDQVQDRVIRFDLRSEKTTRQSVVITPLLSGENRPSDLQSSFNRIMLRIPESGVLLLDAQGSFSQKISTSAEALVCLNKQYLLVYEPAGYLERHHLESGAVDRLLLPLDNQVKAMACQADRLAFLLKGQILFYRLAEN